MIHIADPGLAPLIKQLRQDAGIPERQPFEIFLSFAGMGAQVKESEAIARAMRAEGIRVYRVNDETSIVGLSQTREFKRIIEEAKLTVFIASANYWLRPWCLFEYIVALAHQIETKKRRFVVQVRFGEDGKEHAVGTSFIPWLAGKKAEENVREVLRYLKSEMHKDGMSH